MRSMIVLAMAALAVGTAQAQIKGQATTRSDTIQPPKSAVQAASTNLVYRSLKNPNIAYSGVAVRAVKSRSPWQLINPLAPAAAGPAEASVVRDTISGRAEGIKLFSVAFW